VAFGVDHYLAATGDDDFFRDYGAEVVMQAARFWNSRAEFNRETGEYSINRVIGPDEFHAHVDDSVYTNMMAQWTLRKGMEYAALSKSRYPDTWRRIERKMQLTEKEMNLWNEVSNGLRIIYDEKSGIYEEFDGYFRLKDITVTEFDGNGMPVIRNESEEVLRSPDLERWVADTQLIKQADVVMLQYLLNEDFDSESKCRNFTYYEERTTHKSSLSPSIYAAMGVEVGETERAYRNFMRTAQVDLVDSQGTTDQGIHAAAMGGTWQAAINGFAGMRVRDGKLSFDPHLPDQWQSMKFKIKWHGYIISIYITHYIVELYADIENRQAQIEVAISGRKLELGAGKTYRVPL
jgi:kojibiose phosphorylase